METAESKTETTTLGKKEFRYLVLGLIFIPLLVFAAGFSTASLDIKSPLINAQSNVEPMSEQEIMAGREQSFPSIIPEAIAAESSEMKQDSAQKLNELKHYSVQVAMFRTMENAVKYAAHLQERDYAIEIILDTQFAAEPHYRLIYGIFNQHDKAILEAKSFVGKNKAEAIVLERVS